MRLTLRLLAQMKEALPQTAVSQMFAQMAETMVHDFTSDTNTDGLTMEQRLSLMQDILSKEGFSVEWQKQGDQYHIREISCPYLHITQNHPEVCSVDQTLISSLLSVPAQKIECVLNGDAHCTYIVNTTNP
jgi:predicted ArsR family transcriptional regulator